MSRLSQTSVFLNCGPGLETGRGPSFGGELGFSFVDVVNSIQTRHGMGD